MHFQIDSYDASRFEAVGVLLLYVGMVVTLAGLWQLAGGLRTVVSGRIDEKQRSAGSLKRGVPFLAIGLTLLLCALWLMRTGQ